MLQPPPLELVLQEENFDPPEEALPRATAKAENSCSRLLLLHLGQVGRVEPRTSASK